MERSEVLRRARLPGGDPNRLTVTDAAKHLGISRTRVTQLLKKQAAKAARPAPAPAPIPPAAPPPAAPGFRIVTPEPMPTPPAAPPAGQPPAVPEPPPAPPKDLNGVLNPAGAPPVNTPPPPGDVDADDAEAGRELLGWIRRGAAEFAARFVYKANPDDPRLEKLKEENKFLKVSLKRNSDKSAPLGWFTRGWLGLALGFGIEFVKVALTFPKTVGPAPRPGDPPPPGPASAPTAPPVSTIEENHDQVEGRTRLTIEERIRLSQQGGK